MTNYQEAKDKLRSYAQWTKARFRNDKPAIREAINIHTHELASDFDLTEHKKNLLHNYACALHPKD
jgi:hypothetical protein